MPNLQTVLQAACDAFNNARNSPTHDYSALGQYFAQNVVMHKVDDAAPVVGTPAKIITYLNQSQAITGYFPKLDYGAQVPAPNPASPKNITGWGYYYDRTDIPVVPISVRYNYHFTNDNLIDSLIALRTDR
jgi:hypothetical protein